LSGPWNKATKEPRHFGYVIEGDYMIPIDKQGRKKRSQKQPIIREVDDLGPMDTERDVNA
jgi:hypothetical protein